MLTAKQACAFATAWQGKRVGVVGDLMLDRYVWGEATRISQEAPIPVVSVRKETARPGGAANVLNNLSTLGAVPVAFGVAGEDEGGALLCGLLEDLGVETAGILRDAARPTTEKTRVIAGNQQVVRVDKEVKAPLSSAIEDALVHSVEAGLRAGRLDAIVLEDYAKGVLMGSVLARVTAAARAAGVPVMLDPHPANAHCASGITLMTPNHNEAFALAGAYLTETRYPIESDDALREVAARIQSRWEVENLLITLGAGGMALYSRGGAPLHVPTRAMEVFDVSGAGDTVITAFTLALLAGATPPEAAIVSNHAAGIVVGKVGTVPVHTEELLQSFHE
ncbi:MAG: hypothetical protein HYV27_08285 [Candidatus Hydrogenedentes bacterium]|nr:hypothetical protein [Candidatus Hydrogenedentota bacterium]